MAGNRNLLVTVSRRYWRRWRKRIREYNSFGRKGERAAERYLRRKGYKIVARRERNRFGEIDLIAVDGRTLVYVEVKARRNADFETPAESVNEEKQRRLTRAALAFAKRNDLLECRTRFDVISIVWPENQRRPDIRHYVHAFEAVGKLQMFH